jgi:hypothetical protein
MPTLYPDLICFWNAYATLSGSRSIGMAAGMIPFSEIRSYLDEKNICGEEERDEWIHWIQFIDAEFMAEAKSKEKSSSTPQKNQHPKPRGKK